MKSILRKLQNKTMSLTQNISTKCIPLVHTFHIPKYTCRTGRSPQLYEDVLTLLRAPTMKAKDLTNTAHCSKNMFLATCLYKHILLHAKLSLSIDKKYAFKSLLLLPDIMLLIHTSNRHLTRHHTHY